MGGVNSPGVPKILLFRNHKSSWHLVPGVSPGSLSNTVLLIWDTTGGPMSSGFVFSLDLKILPLFQPTRLDTCSAFFEVSRMLCSVYAFMGE